MSDRPNYITPAGYAALKAEYDQLFGTERPKLVDTISWAAGNGDRSENGDYIYGRKRLREIDRALNRLSRKLKDAKIVDPVGLVGVVVGIEHRIHAAGSRRQHLLAQVRRGVDQHRRLPLGAVPPGQQ